VPTLEQEWGEQEQRCAAERADEEADGRFVASPLKPPRAEALGVEAAERAEDADAVGLGAWTLTLIVLALVGIASSTNSRSPIPAIGDRGVVPVHPDAADV
jgi:hypothetical protein